MTEQKGTDSVESSGSSTPLSEFIRAHARVILADWEKAVRSHSATRHLPRPALLDHVPAVLDWIATTAGLLAHGGPPPPPTDVAESHALDRLDRGIALLEVIREFSLLRAAILRLWVDGRAAGRPPSELYAIDRAVDQAIFDSTDKYAQTRDRALLALDRLGNAALGSKTLDDFLERLLEVLLESIPGADTAAILLREGDQLRLRAATGFEREVEHGFTVPIGEGFAGTIAAEQKPNFLSDGAADPLVNPVIRERGVRALYGVPLMDEQRVIGVLHVGSVSTREFSGQDERIVAALAGRAAAGIAQHLLRERAAHLVEVLELGDPCVVLDRDWRVVFINANLRRHQTISLHNAGDIVGEVCWEVWPETARPESVICRDLHRAQRERTQVDFEYLNEQTGKWWLGSAYPTRDQGLSVFFREVTQLKRAGEEARQAARMREEILAIVSHDLRNPLGAIGLASSLLAPKVENDARAEKHIRTIQRSVDRMTHLVGDLLDMASIHAGRFAIQKKPEDACAILGEAFASQEPAAREKGVTLVPAPEADGRVVECDRDRILQVFGNLIGNAIKFCRAGDSIRLLWQSNERGVEFVVADTGPGISEQELPHIFEPYWSAERHAKKGTGLGLYISRGIVEAHGGKIWVESSAGQGAVFHFTIP